MAGQMGLFSWRQATHLGEGHSEFKPTAAGRPLQEPAKGRHTLTEKLGCDSHPAMRKERKRNHIPTVESARRTANPG